MLQGQGSRAHSDMDSASINGRYISVDESSTQKAMLSPSRGNSRAGMSLLSGEVSTPVTVGLCLTNVSPNPYAARMQPPLFDATDLTDSFHPTRAHLQSSLSETDSICKGNGMRLAGVRKNGDGDNEAFSPLHREWKCQDPNTLLLTPSVATPLPPIPNSASSQQSTDSAASVPANPISPSHYYSPRGNTVGYLPQLQDPTDLTHLMESPEGEDKGGAGNPSPYPTSTQLTSQSQQQVTSPSRFLSPMVPDRSYTRRKTMARMMTPMREHLRLADNSPSHGSWPRRTIASPHSLSPARTLLFDFSAQMNSAMPSPKGLTTHSGQSGLSRTPPRNLHPSILSSAGDFGLSLPLSLDGSPLHPYMFAATDYPRSTDIRVVENKTRETEAEDMEERRKRVASAKLQFDPAGGSDEPDNTSEPVSLT